MFNRKPSAKSIIEKLPDGEYIINGMRVELVTGFLGSKLIYSKNLERRYIAAICYLVDGWVDKKGFERYVGMKARHITEDHIKRIDKRKDDTMNCPRQGVSMWLCPHCQTLTPTKPGQVSCPHCCCFGEMAVRFHAPEPTGKELLREILKPGMTVKLCDEVCHVASSYAGNTFVKPAYNCGCFLLLDFSPTRFSEKDFKFRVGKSVESITRSDIEILFDPEAK